MRDLLPENRPLLILAPMQDITDLRFWRVMSHYGGPDVAPGDGRFRDRRVLGARGIGTGKWPRVRRRRRR